MTCGLLTSTLADVDGLTVRLAFVIKEVASDTCKLVSINSHSNDFCRFPSSLPPSQSLSMSAFIEFVLP